MKEYHLLSEFSPEEMMKSVKQMQEAGFDLHGDLVACPWTEESRDMLTQHYTVLFQWMEREI